MTRSEAIDMLRQIREYLTAGNPIWDIEPIEEACDMAIEALTAEPTQTNDANTLNALDCVERQAAVSRVSDLLMLELKGRRLPTWDEVNEAINELPSALPRWIPVTDAEPQESGDYLLYRPHFWGANKGQITVCYWNGHEWSDNYKNDAERFLPKVYGMAWMPLPEPWKGADDE